MQENPSAQMSVPASVQDKEGKANTGSYKYGIRAPIIVYQMGKVGSRSVYESLKKLELDVPVYHCHVLNNLEKVEQGVRQLLTAPEESLRAVREGQQLRELILSDKDRKWNLVSLVRE